MLINSKIKVKIAIGLMVALSVFLGCNPTPPATQPSVPSASSKSFFDESGKLLLTVALDTNGELKEIFYHTYRPDDNVDKDYEFLASGELRRWTIHKYAADGEWQVGERYVPPGRRAGNVLTKPDSLVYGEKRKRVNPER